MKNNGRRFIYLIVKVSGQITILQMQESNFLMLITETWLHNDEHIDVPSFDCCVQFEREGEPAKGVALYHQIDKFNIAKRQVLQ